MSAGRRLLSQPMESCRRGNVSPRPVSVDSALVLDLRDDTASNIDGPQRHSRMCGCIDCHSRTSPPSFLRPFHRLRSHARAGFAFHRLARHKLYLSLQRRNSSVQALVPRRHHTIPHDTAYCSCVQDMAAFRCRPHHSSIRSHSQFRCISSSLHAFRKSISVSVPCANREGKVQRGKLIGMGGGISSLVLFHTSVHSYAVECPWALLVQSLSRTSMHKPLAVRPWVDCSRDISTVSVIVHHLVVVVGEP